MDYYEMLLFFPLRCVVPYIVENGIHDDYFFFFGVILA